MSRKMHINRLEKDELTYELTVRGIGTGNVEEMRHRLSLAMQLERSGDNLKYPKYPFTFEEDCEAVKKKLDELELAIEQFNNTKNSNEGTKIQTKLSHALGRIDNTEIGDDVEKSRRKSELLALALSLMDKFNEKSQDYEKKKIGVPAALCLLENQIEQSTFHEDLYNASRSSAIDEDNVRVRTDTGAISKMIPPHKWDIRKFSGDGKSMSVNAFFEQVEKLRIARNVSKVTLLDAGIDLFTDKAYQFYKDCRLRVQTWEELVQEFKKEYLSANHNEVLFEELQRRTQHHSESIGVYLAVMSGYFSRLDCTISEEAKLSIIMKNLHPFYQDRLRDPLPATVSELREICRRMEARRDLINSYVEPTRRGNVIEKDLAYVDVADNIGTLQIEEQGRETSRSREIICFKCNKPGHKAFGCTMPIRKHCFKCNLEGHTVKTCPKCSRTGNGTRRS